MASRTGRGAAAAGAVESASYPFARDLKAAECAQYERDGAFMVAGHRPAGAVVGIQVGGASGSGAALVSAAPSAPAAMALVWVAAESVPGLERGAVVALPPGSAVLGDRTVAPWCAGHVFLQQMNNEQVDDFAVEDLRVLSVRFHLQGDRYRDFSDAVARLQGPRTAMWVLKNIRQTGGSPQVQHDQWVRVAKVPDGDRSVYEHEVICRVLQSMTAFDQLNLPALQSAELLRGRLQLIKEAHRISSSAPGYSAGGHFMGWGSRRHGNAVAPALSQFVSLELKNEAAIAKEARKAREENSLRRHRTAKGRGKGPPAAEAAA